MLVVLDETAAKLPGCQTELHRSNFSVAAHNCTIMSGTFPTSRGRFPESARPTAASKANLEKEIQGLHASWLADY